MKDINKIFINKRTIAIILLFITLFSNISPVLAISGSGTENFVGGQFATFIHTTDNANTEYGILARRLIRMNDTTQRFTVFCVEHGVEFDTRCS